MTAIAELRHVHKAFSLHSGDRLDVLHDINLTINAGERVAIVGRSGSGKSTLLNILGLLDPPTHGDYLCDGEDVAELGDIRASALRGSFVGFVFQQFHLIDGRTALQNVAEPLLFADAPSRMERTARARELLARVGLHDRMHALPHLLSGGERQRVAIARALVRHPRLILADEPTGSLDVRTGELVLQTLVEVSEAQQVALVLVTHDAAVAARAERVFLLEDGVLKEQSA